MALKTVLAAALVATLPSLAFAQETVKPAATTSATGGMTMADKASVKVTYVTAQPADVMSSKLIGLNVYNNANESVGEIEDLVIVDGKTVSAVILGVGGFLGMGERSEEIPSAMEDLRDVGIDILTMGQYLQPTSFHLPVDRWVHPD